MPICRLSNCDSKSKQDDNMPMCLSDSHDDDIMPMCLSDSQDDDNHADVFVGKLLHSQDDWNHSRRCCRLVTTISMPILSVVWRTKIAQFRTHDLTKELAYVST